MQGDPGWQKALKQEISGQQVEGFMDQENTEVHEAVGQSKQKPMPGKTYKSEEALTLQDLACLADGLPLPRYDAFVLYGEEEEDFSLEVLVPNLEAQGLSVVVKDRDLLGGSFEQAAVMRLVSERCNKLVTVFSPSFFRSRYNYLLATFAQSQGTRGAPKLIPLVYEQGDIPGNLDMCHKLA